MMQQYFRTASVYQHTLLSSSDFDAAAYSETIRRRLHVKELESCVARPIVFPGANVIGLECVKRNIENVSKIFKAAFILK